MRCVEPFLSGGVAYGCGHCGPCRQTKSRVWTHRIILEALEHDFNSFATLTYEGQPTDLDPKHTQDWLKRLRKRVFPAKLRYFLSGEYGTKTGRPHYHAALFGFPPCFASVPATSGGCPCVSCSTVRETWGFGHIMLGQLTTKSSAYIAGYVTKKLLKTSLFDDRVPEFTRMSRCPGIGATAMKRVGSVSMSSNWLKRNFDVPGVLNHSATSRLPLGRFLVRKLREECGLSPDAPEQGKEELKTKVRIVQELAWRMGRRDVKSVWREINEPYEAKALVRHKIYGDKI